MSIETDTTTTDTTTDTTSTDTAGTPSPIPAQAGAPAVERQVRHEPDPAGAPGPLDQDAARRLHEADTLVVATADRYGERDVTVLAGDRCAVHVIDSHLLAWPDEGGETARAYRANLAEASALAVLVLAGEESARRALHLNGSAEILAVGAARERHPSLPSDPVPGRRTAVWVVVAVGDAYALDGDDVPPVGVLEPGGPPAPAGAPGSRTGAGRAPTRSTMLLVGGLLALVVALVVALVATAVGLSGGPSDEGPVAEAATAPVVQRGRVVDVPDVSSAVVDLGGVPTRVDVVGLGTPSLPCAEGDALAFARRTLQDRVVTLVPDPTLPSAPGLRAHLVLESQLSYTDAVISAGWARATGPAQYSAVFLREQADAERAGRGMWGPPCAP